MKKKAIVFSTRFFNSYEARFSNGLYSPKKINFEKEKFQIELLISSSSLHLSPKLLVPSIPVPFFALYQNFSYNWCKGQTFSQFKKTHRIDQQGIILTCPRKGAQKRAIKKIKHHREKEGEDWDRERTPSPRGERERERRGAERARNENDGSQQQNRGKTKP